MNFIPQMSCKNILLQSKIKFYENENIRHFKNTDVTYGGVASDPVQSY